MREQPVDDEKRRGEHSTQVVAQHRCRRLKLGEPGKLAGAEGNPPANRFTFELTR